MSTNDGYKSRLYFKMAKMKACQLPQENGKQFFYRTFKYKMLFTDRIKAFKFIKIIESENEANKEELRLHAIKLLLLSLTAKKLIPPFHIAPTQSTNFRSINWAKYQPRSMVNEICIIEKDNGQKPAVDLSISGDRHQMVAYQEIPSFGAHFYYAYSPNDPIENWVNVEKSLTK